MLPHKNILFDLDGTLTDPSIGIIRCYQYALEKLNAPAVEDEQIRRLIGPPLRAGFAQFLEDPNNERIEEAVRLYRERFTDIGLYEAQLTSQVPQTLHALKSAGKTLFVVTSKMQHFAERTLAHFNIDLYFDGVFGGALSSALDDKAEIVANCVRSARIGPTESIMIGDRMHDFHAAQRHGIETIGVRCGFAEEGELESLGCVTIVNDISELLSLELSNL